MAEYNSLIARAQQVGQTPFIPYTNQMTAPMVPEQVTATHGINQFATAAQPGISQAEGLITGQAIPYLQQSAGMIQGAAQPLTAAEIQNYYNPWQSSVINATEQQMNLMNQQAQNNLVGNAASVGALGGNRIGVAEAQLQGQELAQETPVIAGLEQQGYTQALGTAAQQYQQNPMAAAYGIGNVATGIGNEAQGIGGLALSGQSAGLQGAGAQFQAGTAQQATQQAIDDAAFRYYQMQAGYPEQMLNWESGIGSGIGSLMGGTGYSTTTGPAPNQTAQYLGLGLAGLGLFSDRRLKEDARVIGHTKDGQKIYSFKFPGDPRTHIGLMSDEVRRKHPEAVYKVGPWDAVNYDLATRNAIKRARGGVAGFGDIPHFQFGGAPEGGMGGFGGFNPNAGPYGETGPAYGGGPTYIPTLQITHGSGPPQVSAPGMPQQQTSGMNPNQVMQLGKSLQNFGNTPLGGWLGGSGSGDWAGGPDESDDFSAAFGEARGGRIPHLQTGGKAGGGLGLTPGGSFLGLGAPPTAGQQLSGMLGNFVPAAVEKLDQTFGLSSPTTSASTSPTTAQAAPTPSVLQAPAAAVAALGMPTTATAAPPVAPTAPLASPILPTAVTPSASTAPAGLGNAYAPGFNAAAYGGWNPNTALAALYGGGGNGGLGGYGYGNNSGISPGLLQLLSGYRAGGAVRRHFDDGGAIPDDGLFISDYSANSPHVIGGVQELLPSPNAADFSPSPTIPPAYTNGVAPGISVPPVLSGSVASPSPVAGVGLGASLPAINIPANNAGESAVADSLLASTPVPTNMAPPSAPAIASSQPGTTVRGSWFGTYAGNHDWVDPKEPAGYPTASGIGPTTPGIALQGKGTMGQLFKVTAPNGNSAILPRIDTGPNPSTGRGVDISAAAAEKLGYTPNNFPTNGQFKVEPAPPDATGPAHSTSPSLDAGSGRPTVAQDGKVVPQGVVQDAMNLVKNGANSAQLQQFMRREGYPMSGNWCGEFAASVVHAMGGQPPSGAAVATNWLNFGRGVDPNNIQTGDVAVLSRGHAIGETGGHVGFVGKVYADRSFDLVGGNQGQASRHVSPDGFQFRRDDYSDNSALAFQNEVASARNTPLGGTVDHPVSPGVSPSQTQAAGVAAPAGFGQSGLLSKLNFLGLSPEERRGLLGAGMGMLASKSPFLGVAVGEGAQAGLQQYAQENTRDLAVRRLGIEAERARSAIAKETAETTKLGTENQLNQWMLRNRQNFNQGTPPPDPDLTGPPALVAPVAKVPLPPPPSGATTPVAGAGPSPPPVSARGVGAPPAPPMAAPLPPSRAPAPTPAPMEAPPAPAPASAPSRTPQPVPAPNQATQPEQPEADPIAGALVPPQWRGREQEYVTANRQTAQQWNTRALAAGNAGLTSEATQAKSYAEHYENIANRVSDALKESAGERYKTDTASYNKQLQGIHGAAFAAVNMKPHLDLARGLLNDPNFYSGAGEKIVLGYKRALAALGGDPNAPLPQEAFRKIMAQNVQDQIDQLKAEAAESGAGSSRIFQAQVRLMEAAAQNPDNSIAANRLLTEIGSRVAKRQTDIADMADDYKGGHLDAGFNKQLRHWETNHQLFTPEELQNPQLLAAPTARTEQDVARLPHGTRFRIEGTDPPVYKVAP